MAQESFARLRGRQERSDFLQAYLECVLRLPHAQMSWAAKQMHASIGLAVSTHSLGGVLSSFFVAMRVLYGEVQLGAT